MGFKGREIIPNKNASASSLNEGTAAELLIIIIILRHSNRFATSFKALLSNGAWEKQ